MSADVDIAVARLKIEEGFRSKRYLDSKGLETIGYGFNLAAGISEYAAAALLAAQVEELRIALAAYAWFQGLDEPRASVFLDVAFNDGLAGLLHYVNTIAAVAAKSWQRAHDELLDSDAARTLPDRYRALAQILLTGIV